MVRELDFYMVVVFIFLGECRVYVGCVDFLGFSFFLFF